VSSVKKSLVKNRLLLLHSWCKIFAIIICDFCWGGIDSVWACKGRNMEKNLTTTGLVGKAEKRIMHDETECASTNENEPTIK